MNLSNRTPPRRTGCDGTGRLFVGVGEERMMADTADIRDLSAGVLPSSRAGRVRRSDRNELAHRYPIRAAVHSAIPADLPVHRPPLRAVAGNVQGKGGVQPGKAVWRLRDRPTPASAALTNPVGQMAGDVRP